jgi:hypothetical protein
MYRIVRWTFALSKYFRTLGTALASRPSEAIGLGLCGIALLGYTQLGVVDAEDGLSDELDGLAGDFLLIRIFAGAQLALDQDRIALLEGAGEFGPCEATIEERSAGSIITFKSGAAVPETSCSVKL